jgi:uncharacterized membrane protein YqaE (UPF0057 family)
MSANGIDEREARIDANNWTLFDRLMYGGLGYGAFCLPTNFFKIIFTVIFPPLGEILNVVSDFISDEFPYITWKTLKAVMNNMERIIYSFILTSMFYVPGLIYSLGNITCDEHSTGDDENEVVTVNKYESFDDIEDDEEDDEEDDDEDDEKDEDEE